MWLEVWGLIACLALRVRADCPKNPLIKSCPNNTCQFIFPGVPPALAPCTAGQVLTSSILCDEQGRLQPWACTASDIKISQPSVAKVPSYSWTVSASIADKIVAPTWHTNIVVSHPHKINHGANDVFGDHNDPKDLACGSNHTFTLGQGQPGGEGSVIYCPDCRLRMDFPPCPWAKGSIDIRVSFSMNYWVVPNLDAYNTTLMVHDDHGKQVLKVRSFGDLLPKLPPSPPSPSPPSPVPPAPTPPGPAPPTPPKPACRTPDVTDACWKEMSDSCTEKAGAACLLCLANPTTAAKTKAVGCPQNPPGKVAECFCSKHLDEMIV